MVNKYHMSVKQNIFVAKRNIVDYIWKSARLEGLSVTYPDTDSIFNGLSISGVKVDDIIVINNLKHAWKFVLENVDYPIDYPFICYINKLVGSTLFEGAGFIRKLPFSIGGTKWRPDIPIESRVKEQLIEIRHMQEPTDRAITLMLYIMRKQMFLDGNKRTAMLAANAEMIASGAGIISVPVEYQPQFRRLLVEYYETGYIEEVKKFVYDNCIDGMVFPEPSEEFLDPKFLASIFFLDSQKQTILNVLNQFEINDSIEDIIQAFQVVTPLHQYIAGRSEEDLGALVIAHISDYIDWKRGLL